MSRSANKSKLINGQQWYYYLVPQKNHIDYNGRVTPNSAISLFDKYNINEICDKLIISMTTSNEKNLYTVFDSYIEFAIYQQKMPPEKRCFYENIMGDYPQKPHFDIDISITQYPNIDPELIKDSLISNLIDIFKEIGITLNLYKDLLIFTSHGKEKYSYHVVINNYCHINNKEAKALYKLVTNRMPSDYVKFIDHSVYSSKQQFRVVGSQKLGSRRPKILNDTWYYQNNKIQHQYPELPEDDDHRTIIQLEISLVSYTKNCTLIPSLLSNLRNNSSNESDSIKLHDPSSCPDYDTEEDISKELAIRALQMCADLAGMSWQDRSFPYVINSIKGSMIMLKRTRPSKCRICNRIHEHENPYLYVSGIDRCVYFHCRRAPPGQKLYLGKLGADTDSYVETKYSTVAINWAESVLKNYHGKNIKVKTPSDEPDDAPKQIIIPLGDTGYDITKLACSSIGITPIKTPPSAKKHHSQYALKKASQRGRWKLPNQNVNIVHYKT